VNARDVTTVLDAAYATAESETVWLENVVRAALPHLDQGAGLHAWIVDLAPDGSIALRHPMAVGVTPEWAANWRTQWWDVFMEGARPADVRFLHQFAVCSYATTLWDATRVGAPTYAQYLGHLARTGYGRTHARFVPPGERPVGDGPRLYPDSFNVAALDASDRGCALVANLTEPHEGHRVPPAVAALWERLAAHLAAALRLQRAMWPAGTGGAELILEGDGRIAHAEGLAETRDVRDRLRDAMLRVDAIRRRTQRTDPGEVLETWRALHDGRWSVVEQFERDGRRYILARPNVPKPHSPEVSLSEREAQVARLVAQGQTNKLVAYALGVSVSTVGTLVHRAMAKLGARNRAELIARVHERTDPGIPTDR